MGQQADQQTMVLLRRVLRNPARPGHLPWVKYEYGKRPAACYKPNVRRDSCESSRCDTAFPFATRRCSWQIHFVDKLSIRFSCCTLADFPDAFHSFPSTLHSTSSDRHS